MAAGTGVDVAEAIAALGNVGSRIKGANRRTTRKVAELVQKFSREAAPVGKPGWSTNPPGDLRASILVDGPRWIGANRTMATVGPTVRSVDRGVNYGRIRELGGTIFPQAKPYLAWKTPTGFVKATIVHQEGAHYMQIGRDEAAAFAYAEGVKAVIRAIEG